MSMLLVLSCLAYITSNYVTQGVAIQQTYIQIGNPVPNIPCVGLNPDEQISLLYWYKGETLQEALETVLVRYASTVGTNYTVSDRYSLATKYGLTIRSIEVEDSGRYWCRFVRQNTGGQSEDAVDVVVVTPREPVLSLCTPSDSHVFCKADASRRLIVDCSVTNAVPRPDLTWSFIGCSDSRNQSQQWFVSNPQISAFDEDTESYNVTSGIYLGILELEKGDNCSFECTANGDAIVNGSSSRIIVVSGRDRPTSEDTPGNWPNTAGTAGIIVLAFISLACLIGIIYLAWRLWRRGSSAGMATEEIEINKLKDSHDETVCLLHTEPAQDDTRDITGEMTNWQYKGMLAKRHNDSGDTIQGVIGVLPSAIGGLVIATESGLLCFSAKFAELPVKEDPIVSDDNIMSIANHPNSDYIIASLKDGRLIFVNILTAQIKSVTQTGTELRFSTCDISVDDVGVIFVGERNVKAITMIETSKAFTKQYKLDITVANIAAYGSKRVFVSDGRNVIHKYHFKTAKGGYDATRVIKIKQDNPSGSFVIRQITVHSGLLYTVNGNERDCFIKQYDVETVNLLQTFRSSLTDVQGLCFFGEHKVALYETKAVKIYEKRDTDRLDSYVLV